MFLPPYLIDDITDWVKYTKDKTRSGYTDSISEGYQYQILEGVIYIIIIPSESWGRQQRN